MLDGKIGRVSSVASSALARYRRLVRPAGAWSALVLGTLARLPIGMTGLALLLLVQRETGSIARGSLVSAVYSAALALAAPLRGSDVDRRGARFVLLVYGAVHPVALLAVLGAVLGGLGLPYVLTAGVLAGVTFPPVGPLVRALWGVLYDEEADLATAYALDAVLVEVAFVGGPLLVGLAVAIGHPALAVAGSAILVAIGALLLGRTRVARRLVPRERHERAPLRAPLVSSPVRRLLAAIVLLGVAFGAIEVAVTAFALERGSRALAGPLLAVWALGSALGGVTYGARAWGIPVTRQYPYLVAALAGALALPLLAYDTWSLAALLLLGGGAIAPFLACNSALLARAAPPAATTATFAWSGSGIVGGIAAGIAAAGWLVEQSGSGAGFGLAAAGGLAALVVALTRR